MRATLKRMTGVFVTQVAGRRRAFCPPTARLSEHPARMGIRRPRTPPLFQQPQQRLPGLAIQLLGVERAILVRIGRVEALLHDGEVFICRERTVMVWVGGG